MEDNRQYWFVAVVRPNNERSCCDRLENMFKVDGQKTIDFETYLPLHKELHVWRNGRKKMIERNLCPKYIFIRCTEPVRKSLKIQAPFINRFLINRSASPDEHGRYPFAYVPDDQMAILKIVAADPNIYATIDPRKLEVGMKVRVIAGSLKDVEGYIYENPDGRTSLVIWIDSLGCAKIDIPLEYLEIV